MNFLPKNLSVEPVSEGKMVGFVGFTFHVLGPDGKEFTVVRILQSGNHIYLFVNKCNVDENNIKTAETVQQVSVDFTNVQAKITSHVAKEDLNASLDTGSLGSDINFHESILADDFDYDSDNMSVASTVVNVVASYKDVFNIPSASASDVEEYTKENSKSVDATKQHKLKLQACFVNAMKRREQIDNKKAGIKRKSSEKQSLTIEEGMLSTNKYSDDDADKNDRRTLNAGSPILMKPIEVEADEKPASDICMMPMEIQDKDDQEDFMCLTPATGDTNFNSCQTPDYLNEDPAQVEGHVFETLVSFTGSETDEKDFPFSENSVVNSTLEYNPKLDNEEDTSCGLWESIKESTCSGLEENAASPAESPSCKSDSSANKQNFPPLGAVILSRQSCDEDSVSEISSQQCDDLADDTTSLHPWKVLKVHLSKSSENPTESTTPAAVTENKAPTTLVSPIEPAVSERKERTKKGNDNSGDFTCQYCGKTLLTVCGLKMHERSCSGTKSFQCDVCGRKFAQKATLISHVNTHIKGKPLACEYCGKHFRFNERLQRHIKVIHGEAPRFVCEFCGRGFFLREPYEKHKNVVHLKLKPHACEVCGRSFSELATLSSHYISHTNIAAFNCPYCEKKFKYKSTLYRHKSKQHAEELVAEKQNRIILPS